MTRLAFLSWAAKAWERFYPDFEWLRREPAFQTILGKMDA